MQMVIQKRDNSAAKLPYESPKAIFVPLKIEERLMSCQKLVGGVCDPINIS